MNRLLFLSGGVAGAALGFLAARKFPGSVSESRRIRELKIDELEIGRLKIERAEHEHTMEESGGVLRFELGSPDLYENGLE